MRIFAVTGAIGAGKTKALQAVSERIQRLGASVGGVIQVCQHLPSGRRAYVARCLNKRDSALVAMVGGPTSTATFFQEGFTWASQRILASVDVCVVDELGWVEVEGRGHWPALRRLLRQESAQVLLVSLRRDFLDEFARRLTFEEVWHVFGDEPAPVDRWARRIVGVLDAGFADSME